MINLEMPEDVQQYVRKYQNNMKEKKNTSNYSQPQAIIAIIREHQELKEEIVKLRKIVGPSEES